MTTIVTFLGDRGLLETKYRFGDRDRSYTGGVFAEALVQFCEFDRMIVCVTEKAKLNTWSKLVNLQNDLANARAIATLWKELANLRNDLAHCGMNKRPMLATKMRECAMGIGRSLMPSIWDWLRWLVILRSKT